MGAGQPRSGVDICALQRAHGQRRWARTRVGFSRPRQNRCKDMPKLDLKKMYRGPDDSTGTVPYALFRPEEDAAGYLLLMEGMITRRGVPLALYSDRHAVFKNPAPPRQKLPGPTQFMHHPADLRPVAPGQGASRTGGRAGRLVTELLAKAETIEDANEVLHRSAEVRSWLRLAVLQVPAQGGQPPEAIPLDSTPSPLMPTATPTPVPTATASPTPSPIPTATATPSATPTSTPTATPTPPPREVAATRLIRVDPGVWRWGGLEPRRPHPRRDTRRAIH